MLCSTDVAVVGEGVQARIHCLNSTGDVVRGTCEFLMDEVGSLDNVDDYTTFDIQLQDIPVFFPSVVHSVTVLV